MIADLGLSAIEKITNACLQLDPEFVERLSPYRHKIAKITVSDWAISLYVQPSAQGFYWSKSSNREADTCIEGRLIDLFKMACPGDAKAALVSPIKISGDLDFGQNLHSVLRNLDLDWEEPLSRLIGDTAAHQCMQQVRGAFKWLKRSISTLGDNTQEYIQEEARLSPSIEETEDFYQEIARLRDDVDRAEQRIEALFKRTKNV